VKALQVTALLAMASVTALAKASLAMAFLF
jgi:hypothetical protein